jgi:hypothetical protein
MQESTFERNGERNNKILCGVGRFLAELKRPDLHQGVVAGTWSSDPWKKQRKSILKILISVCTWDLASLFCEEMKVFRADLSLIMLYLGPPNAQHCTGQPQSSQCNGLSANYWITIQAIR